MEHSLLDTDTEEGHTVLHQRTSNDDAFEVERINELLWVCALCAAKTIFNTQKNCGLFIHLYLNHITESIALYDQTIHSPKLKYQPE